MRIILFGIMLAITGAIAAQATEPAGIAQRSGTAPVTTASGPTSAEPAAPAALTTSFMLDKDNMEDKVKDSLGLTKSKPVHSRHRRRHHHRRHHAPPAKPQHHSDKGKTKDTHHPAPSKPKGH